MPVRHALLGLIAQRPRYGYELYTALTALVGGRDNWDLKAPQVYTTLSRLEKSGLVTEESIEKDGDPDKHIYAITVAGQAELDKWLQTGVPSEYQRDEFFLKLMLGLERSDIDTRKVLHVQREMLYKELHRITAQRQQADTKTDLAHILLMDKTIMYLEADLRWLEMIETRLDDMLHQSLPEPELRPRGRPPKDKAL